MPAETVLLPSASTARLAQWLDGLACCWLVLLPSLRPLIWSGDPTTAGNLLFAAMLAGAIATGLLTRAISGDWPRPSWLGWLGIGVLTLLAISALRSPSPAAAWTLWAGWALHIGAPLSLLPQIRRFPALVCAGLGMGVIGEALIIFGEQKWERPGLRAQYATDPSSFGDDHLRGQYEARLDTWRASGSFLLANTLGAFVITVLPLLCGWAIAAWSACGWRRWCALALTVIGVACLIESGSKAAGLALLLAAAATVLLFRSTARMRVLIVSAALLMIALALLLPPTRHALAASAGVRVDYWRGALALIAERPLCGFGLDGFAAHFPRVKPPAAEETVLAHNELLQAAVDGGLLLALALAAWWLGLLRQLARASPPDAHLSATAPPRWLLLGVGLGFVIALLLGVSSDTAAIGGALDEQVRLWPGAPWRWGVAFSAVMVAALPLLRRLPTPPRWVWWCGVTACLLHALADFHLHSPQVVLPLVLMVCLGLPPRREQAHPSSALRTTILVAAAMLIVALSTWWSWRVGLRHDLTDRSDTALNALRRELTTRGQAGTSTADVQMAAQLDLQVALVRFGQLGLGVDPVGPLLDAARADLELTAFAWPVDERLAFADAQLITLGRDLGHADDVHDRAWLERCAARWPAHAGFAIALANCHAAAGRADDALRESARAVTLYPTHLPLREVLIARARIVNRTDIITHETAVIRALQHRVHPNNAPQHFLPEQGATGN